MKKKQKILLAIVVSAILIVTLAGIILFSGPSEASMKRSVERMGLEFWNEFYTEVTKNLNEEEIKAELEIFTDNGLRINLEGLFLRSEKNQKIIARLKNKGEACNMATTEFAVFPKAPFGINDHNISVTLDCGF
jgi:ABC-type glycerol-3-phosphate transport system substrate-binding protein